MFEFFISLCFWHLFEVCRLYQSIESSMTTIPNQFVPFGLFNGVSNFELRSSLTKLMPRARLPFGSITEGESTSPPGAALPVLAAAPGGNRLFSTSIFS